MHWALLAQILSMTVPFKNHCRSRKRFATCRDHTGTFARHVPKSLICHQLFKGVGRTQQIPGQTKSFRSVTRKFS
jgi:hypothetical protein